MKTKIKRRISDLTRKRMRKAHLGKKHSPETIEKIRAAKKERDAEYFKLVELGMEPFHHSEATKAKLRRIALKQKRRHRLSPKDKQKGARSNKIRADEKRFEKRVKQQIKDGVFS